ncbi:MAG: DUF481 domain-containing protein [Pseudomonadota bacterium]
MLFRVVLIVLAMLPAATLSAAEDEGPFSGTIKFGFLGTSGNTETSSLNTGATLSYAKGKWEHEATGSAITSAEDDTTTAEAYEAGWRSRWDMTEKDFLFGRLNWRKDRFGAFDTQFSQTLGYGRRLLTGPVHTLNAEIGAGARQSDDQFGVGSDETILFGGLDYQWQFSETASFQQTFALEAGEDNTYIESKSSLSATLVGALSLVASYTVRNNSDVPAGTEKTDTQTAISLEYGF